MRSSFRTMLNRWNASLLMIGMGTLVSVLLITTTYWNWRQQLTRSTADLLVRNLTDNQAPPQIVIVGIDDASLNNTTGFGRLTEWDRGLYAKLLDQLHSDQARVVVFDVLFTGKASKGDRDFAQALTKYPNTVLAVARSGVTAEIEKPVDELAGATNHFGHVNIFADSDGVVRRIPLLINDQTNYETLGLAALRVWWNLPNDARVQVQDTHVRLPNGLDLPTNNGSMLISYVGGRGTFPVYSFRDVIQGKVDPRVFNNAIVLVGATATAMTDHHNTPVAAVMDGVEIHANVIASILSGAQLREQSTLTSNLLVALITIILVTIALLHRPSLLLSVMVLGLLALPFAGMYVLIWQQLRLDMANPALAIILVGIVCLTIQNRVQRQEYQQVLDLFARRTPPTVIDELLQQARNGTLKLGGERREVTVMFIDMRGFTTISERLLPEDLMRIINTYLDIIATTLIDHGGTLNQYAGDQAMAIFNAPVYQPDHAARAVRAARDALLAVNAFNRSAAAQALPALAHFGAGVNTGVGIVGNVGANKRYDYSAIGDVTNTAARLCGAAPADTVYIGPDTMLEELGDLVEAISSIGSLVIKGKEHPLDVFALRISHEGAEA